MPRQSTFGSLNATAEDKTARTALEREHTVVCTCLQGEVEGVGGGGGNTRNNFPKEGYSMVKHSSSRVTYCDCAMAVRWRWWKYGVYAIRTFSSV